MKRDGAKPFVPRDRHETVRKDIEALLRDGEWSAKEISAEVSVSEKMVYDHLAHIQRSMGKKEGRFTLIPSECRKCGFIFKKRDRLTKPGKCPVCRGESVTEPHFSIK